MTTPLPDLVLYSRTGCHLCEDARATLDALLAERRAMGLPVPVLRELDIEADEELHARYALTIPVIAIAGHELELATSPSKVRRLLEDALDGMPTA